MIFRRRGKIRARYPLIAHPDERSMSDGRTLFPQILLFLSLLLYSSKNYRFSCILVNFISDIVACNDST